MATEMRVFLKTKQGQEVIRRQNEQNSLDPEPISIYYDHYCSVTPKFLIVKKYFIPSRLAYEFQWEKIVELTYTPQSLDDPCMVRAKGYDEERRWWAIDALRTRPRNFLLYNIRLETEGTEPSRSGFSVADIDEFLKACRPLLSFNCKISGNRLSNQISLKREEEDDEMSG